MKPKKMRQIHTSIDIKDDENLKLLAEVLGSLSKSEVIRLAIKKYIIENKELVKAQREIEDHKKALMKERRKIIEEKMKNKGELK